MSKADVLFADMCRDILDNGFSSEGQTVRAKWEDGTPAHTIKRFGIVNRYDLQEEFPCIDSETYGNKVGGGRNAVDMAEKNQTTSMISAPIYGMNGQMKREL